MVAARRHVGRQRDMVLAEMRGFADEHSFALEATPSGLIAVPALGDGPSLLTTSGSRRLSASRSWSGTEAR